MTITSLLAYQYSSARIATVCDVALADAARLSTCLFTFNILVVVRC